MVRTKPARPYSLPVLSVLTVAVLSACAASSPRPETRPDSTPPSPGEAVEARLAAPETRTPGAGPVGYRLPEAEGVFPPAPPEGITGIAVPAVVSEPLAVYVTPAGAVPEGLVMTEVPTPLRREPRPTARVEAGSGEAPEAAARGDLGLEEPPAEAAAPTVTFDSLSFTDNSANTGGSIFIPPDPIAAAGPDHVVSVVNVSIQFHTKDGTPLLDAVAGGPVTGISLASFFSPVAPLNATFDPKVIYDQHAGRFVVVTLERQDVLLGDPADTSRILVAVSDDADPNGTWYFTAINSVVTISSVARWADYPGFAVDEEAVYITANMFGFFSSGGAFGGVRMWVIDKLAGAGGGFYGGGTATVSLFDPYGGAGIATTTQPAHIFGAAPTTPNVGTFLVSYSGLTAPPNEFLQIVRIDDPVGPGTTTFTQQYLNIGDIEALSSALPDAPQAGSTELVETNDRRALHSVWRASSLWLTATIDPTTGADAGQATAHWWELDTSTLASITSVQQGDVGGEDIATGTHTFFPSIAVNDSGDVAIGFAASAGSIYPSAAYTTHAAGGVAGSNTGSALLRAGLDYYIRTFDSPPCSASPARNRWGDYSGVALDPFDECFWVYNQYAISRGTGTTGGCNGRPATEDGRWGTAYAYFCESCPTDVALSSLTVNGTESHEARDALTASTVTVEGTGDLTLTSPEIGLESGFNVESGGELTIVNGPCP